MRGVGRLVVAVLLAATFAACDASVAGNLERTEAEALVDRLEADSIPARIERDETAWRVVVDAAYRDPAASIWARHRACPTAPEVPDESLLLGVGPQASAEREARTTGAVIERALAPIDGVACARASIVVTPPRLGAAPEPPRGTLLVAVDETADREAIVELAATAAAGRDVVLDGVRFAPSEAPAAPPLARVGPWRVSPESVPSLRAALGGALILVMLAAVATAAVALRRRRRS